jgi:hypothetical protein
MLTLRGIRLLGVCLGALAMTGPALAKNPAKDLYLGEAFYQAAQGNYFEAITRLDRELEQFYRLDDPKLDPLHIQVNHARFSVGDFELSYRMHQRAGRAIKAVLEGNVDEAVRNEAAWRLARIFMQKNDATNALGAIERIKGRIPERIRHEEQFLRSLIYMHTGANQDAIRILQGLQNVKSYEGFSTYNLGLAYIQSGNETKGFEELAKAGLIKTDDEATLAIKDKANLALGSRLITAGQTAQAKQYLDRVRLSGPFSSKALLGSGWADAAEEKYDRALVPWTLLVKRNVTDKAVQEAFLGVPYAFGKLKLYGRAATLYGVALENFESELTKLDASLKSIREGKFLKALVQDELRHDKNWVVKLRELPDSPETYYLLELMASNDFQESLQNYFDLEDLRKKLDAWTVHLDAYEDIIQVRKQYYDGVLPPLDKQFKALDSQMRLRMEQRQTLHERLKNLLIAPRPDFLATGEERVIREQLNLLAAKHKTDNSPAGEETRRRIQRLLGVLHWNIHTTYNERLTRAYKNLHQLDADVDRLNTIYRSFVRSRQAATQSYRGYDVAMRQLRIKVRDGREKVDKLMARQGNMLDVMAITELEERRTRLEEYQVQARFALAESFDRASKNQEGGPK